MDRGRRPVDRDRPRPGRRRHISTRSRSAAGRVAAVAGDARPRGSCARSARVRRARGGAALRVPTRTAPNICATASGSRRPTAPRWSRSTRPAIPPITSRSSCRRSSRCSPGDAVVGRGTSFIDPPDGDLVQYLRSLRRMQELHPRTIYPGHGPIVIDARAKLDEYVAHRADRERQIRQQLGTSRSFDPGPGRDDLCRVSARGARARRALASWRTC